MNANDLNFDLHALAAPKSRADLIALVKEARAELAIVNGYIDAILATGNCFSEA